MSSPNNAPVETKVKAASIGAALAGLGLALLVWLNDNPGLIEALPDEYEGIVWLLLPTLIVFISGWLAPHTPRSIRHIGNDPTRG